ncbi:polyprenyl synthetase family protein [Streptomyces sp. DH24]|uniref:polyprenyl synthetase family protein n=1 Tax=Streptomyces sp. DH24 TaxID=3040123 RepID=UPI002442E0BC|nr:polyprenyl synthetase family protein [Streptomyces sp. DH24]MDG9720223.1 polyprenyl synthetase family protein [Streptomyces sp. DH24]
MTADQLYEAPTHAAPDGGRAHAAELLRRLGPDEPKFQARVGEALDHVESLLRACTRDAADPRVAALTGHLAATGGKRMRPLLVLLAAEFGDPAREGVAQAAVVAELVHLASLYHDDVVDRAATRHGAPSANALWGNRPAILGGDWLLARAARLSADLVPEALALNSRTASRIVAGQMRELVGPVPGEDPVTHYFRVTAGKTAALLAMSLGVGAHQSGTSPDVADALIEYGEQLGIVFQIADDLLDLFSPAASSGKEQGKDLLIGVPSLPVLLARESTDPRDAELRELLAAGPVAGAGRHRRALDLFAVSQAAVRTRTIMHQRLALARTALDALPPLPARDALDALCDFVARRTG